MTSRLRRVLHYAITGLPPLALVTIAAVQPWFPAQRVFMSPRGAQEIAGDCCRLYDGLASDLGVLSLAAGATACLFAALCLRHLEDAGRVRFLLGAGLATAWLCLDELFGLHERVLPAVGLPPSITIGVYAILATCYVALCRREIRSGATSMLALALVCFAVGAALDLVHGIEGLPIWAGNAAKFAGIAAWTGFHVDTAYRFVTETRARVLDLRLGSELDESIGELDAALEGFRLRQANRTTPRRVPSAAIVGPSSRGRTAASGHRSAARAG